MVLLFLRDWRSALIVVINIPLSLMGAVLALWITKQTINIMTLGGLALAIGILVDMSTVVIENIHTHLGRRKAVGRALVDSGREVALPLLIAMLCVLAVFVPSFFMVGAAKAMFLPLSLSVGFSMVASYLLSSTLVPILSVWVLRGHEEAAAGQPKVEGQFDRFQKRYAALAQRVVRARWLVVGAYLAAAAIMIVFIGRQLGTEIFPKVDAGQLQVRLRAPTGTHVDGTEAIALQALDFIKNEVGPTNVQITLGFVGVHGSSYPINLIYLWNGGSEEGIVQVQLKRGAKVHIEQLKERLRKKFASELPDVSFSFEPNSGVAYQIQVQVPQARMNSLEQVENLPISLKTGDAMLLRNIGKVSEGTTVGQYQRYNMQRMITVTANISNADLGTVAKQVR